MSRTFFVSNFGCRASQSEGASIQEELLQTNAAEATTPLDADVVIINSCTVTSEADRQVRQMIRRVASRNPTSRIIATGCYAQRAPEELAALPQVRYVVGNSHKSMIPQLTLDVFEDMSTHGRAEILCSSIFLEKELRPQPHLGSGGRTRAIVKVQDGCNANCSFCIIPSVRGRSRSMPESAVIQQVGDLVARGYKEVVASGIHLGTYGRDFDGGRNFAGLLKNVLQVPGLERLRLSSIEPLEVSPEIVELVATHPRVAKHFHVPLQSGSSRILRLMYRPYSPEYYAGLIDRIRAAAPQASIGADVMVGFPGETDEDFLATHRLIEQSGLTYLHVFPFSSRPGTVAAHLPAAVPEHVAKYRARTLRELVARKNEAFRRSMLDRELDVLVLDEEPEDGCRAALSDNFLNVRVPDKLEVNRWHRVRISSLAGDSLRSA